MNIIVDLMGSDKGDEELLVGALKAKEEYGVDLTLVGNEKTILDYLNKTNYNSKGISIVNASETITNEDNPVMAIRKKKESSMVIAANLLKEGKGDGVISTGNTGALLASGLFIVGRIKGIDRAAISAPYPTKKGFSIMLDSGANADCKPEYLLQFAKMGSIYAEKLLGVKNPKVGLVNIGSEQGKGNKLTLETYDLLKNSDVNFYGNIESRELTSGEVDVFVCDGFTGNIILKNTEGVAMYIFSILKGKFMKNMRTKLAALLLKKELGEIKELMDYREYGGAPILGVQKPLFKAHGSSDSTAFKNGIKQLIDFIEKDIIKDIQDTL